MKAKEIWLRLWNMEVTYDEKDKWFLIGFITGITAAIVVIGFVQGWLPLNRE